MNVINNVKKHIQNHTTSYITAAAVAGVATGIILTRKFGPEVLSEATVLNNFNDKMNASGFMVLLIDRATEARYIDALKTAL